MEEFMKGYVKYFYFLAVFVLVPTPGFSQGSDQDARDARQKAEKIRLIQDLSAQAFGIIDTISKNYVALGNLNRINAQGQTHIDLTAEIQSEPPSRVQYIYTEKAFIQWQGEKIQNILFDTRKGRSSGSYILKRSLGMAESGQHKSDGMPGSQLNLVYNIRESFETGKKEYSEYRFSDKYELPVNERLSSDGIMTDFTIYKVADEDRKIDIIREFIRMLRVLELRVARTVSTENDKRRTKMETLINK